ncbi:MAG: hypothetical protein NZ741_10375 [Armatimonadetes bacterium]|nr:hypothetical protein [Armatimonadota bacterium]
MRVYVRSVGTNNVTLVDIDSGERFTLSLALFERLFRSKPAEGDVFQLRVDRLEEIAEMFRRWTDVVSRA